MRLPLSVRRYGSQIEQATVVECDDGEVLHLCLYSCEELRCWRVDPDLPRSELANKLYDLAAERINRSLHLRLLVGASRYRPITGGELADDQKVMLIIGKRGFPPAENHLLEVTFRLLFGKEDPGPRVFTLDTLTLPRAVNVTSIPRPSLVEGV